MANKPPGGRYERKGVFTRRITFRASSLRTAPARRHAFFSLCGSPAMASGGSAGARLVRLFCVRPGIGGIGKQRRAYWRGLRVCARASMPCRISRCILRVPHGCGLPPPPGLIINNRVARDANMGAQKIKQHLQRRGHRASWRAASKHR